MPRGIRKMLYLVGNTCLSVPHVSAENVVTALGVDDKNKEFPVEGGTVDESFLRRQREDFIFFEHNSGRSFESIATELRADVKWVSASYRETKYREELSANDGGLYKALKVVSPASAWRIYLVLRRAGVSTLEELMLAKKCTLERTPSLGATTIDVLRRVRIAYGGVEADFRDDEDEW